MTNLRWNVRRGFLQSLLGLAHLVDWHTVQQAAGQGYEDDDLFGNGRRFKFRLFENGSDSLAMVDNLARVLIKAGTELGEGFQLGELCVSKLEIARHRSVDRQTRFV